MDKKNSEENSITQLLREAWPASDCPPSEQWLDALDGHLDAIEVQRMNAHAAGCAACASERKLCSAFVHDGGNAVSADDASFVIGRLRASGFSARTSPTVERGPSMHWRVLQPLLGLAAAAMLVIALSPAISPVVMDSPQLPDRGAAAAARGSVVALISPVGKLQEPPVEFRWQPVAGASRYRITIREVDDSVLWQHTVASTDRLAVPAELAERMHAAVVYFWQVEALNDAGARIAASESTAFRLLPGSLQ